MEIQKLIKQKKFVSGYQKVLVNLLYTSSHLNSELVKILKPYNILTQHYNVLKIIKGKMPDPISQVEILDVMLDKGVDLTRLLLKLEQMKLVTKQIPENNKRIRILSLTNEGLIFVKELEKKVESYMKDNDKLSEKEYDILSSLLDKFRDG